MQIQVSAWNTLRAYVGWTCVVFLGWVLLKIVLRALARFMMGHNSLEDIEQYSVENAQKVDPYRNGVSYAVSYWTDVGSRPYQEDRHTTHRGPQQVQVQLVQPMGGQGQGQRQGQGQGQGWGQRKGGQEDTARKGDFNDNSSNSSSSTGGGSSYGSSSNPRQTSDVSYAYSSMYGIFDGHGGHRASQTCKDKLLQCIAQDPGLHQNPQAAIRNAFFQIDADFSAWARLERYSDGSTAIVALVQDGRVIVGNAGDCRAVLVRKPAKSLPLTGNRYTDQQQSYRVDTIPLSDDHKPNRKDEEQRVKLLGGKVVHWGRWRVQGVLAVSRAIGDVQLQPYITCEPEVLVHKLHPDDDLFLILASDGVWDVLSNEEAGTLVMQAALTKPWEEVAKELVLHAKLMGSLDNITVQVIDLSRCFCKPPAAASKAQAQAQGAGA